jgi:hypothetical protein
VSNAKSFWHSRRVIFAAVALMMSFLSASLAFGQIVGSAQLNFERRAHTATLLDDGKVLIVGGDNQNGMVGQAELLDTVAQTSLLGATLATARTDHSATKLADGRVLVIGGRDGNGALTSTEIYDPTAAAFVAGPSLTTPRSGHTATVLSDGTILIAGGDTNGSAEIYDPLTQAFSLVTGSMNTARRLHSAILAISGQVLIVGGVDAQSAVLNTAEVYDPASQTFYLPPTDLKTPRALATLKLLSDGKIQVIGGDADSTMEVFDPGLGWFNALALLPPTIDSLGATLSTQSRAALISPTIGQDQLLQGALTPEQLALLDRADHTITELPAHNKALVAGGISSSGQILNSATLVSSSSASVTTDKTDYAPGEIVTITGTGFQPNETVNISLHETPEGYPDPAFVATADEQGTFISLQFSPQVIDIGRTFTLTAIGQSSGFAAQTAFTDAINTNTAISSSKNPSNRGESVTFTATVTRQSGGAAVTQGSVTFRIGGNNCNQGTAIATVTVNGSGQASASNIFTAAGNVTVRACYHDDVNSPPNNFGDSNANLTQTVNNIVATTTSLSSSANPSTFGQSISFTATVAPLAGATAPTGSVQFKIDGVNFGSPVALSASGSNGVATSSSISTLTVSGSPHTIEAVYTPTGTFTTSTGTLSGGQTVNKLTVTVTPNSGQFKIYGSADPTLTYGFTPALIGTDTFSGALSRDAGTNVGLYNITQGTLALSSNYTLVFTTGVKFEIRKLTVTVTPNAGQFKIYGSADPTLTYGFTPALIGTDTFSGALSRDAGPDVGLYNITQGTLALSSNYTLVFTTGVKFEIKTLTITVTPNSGQFKIYGSADPTLTYGFTPALIGTDTFSGALSRDAGTNVGLYNITQGTLALSSNYTLVFTTGVKFEIKKLTITVTPNSGQFKIYGSADPTLTYGFTPALIPGDSFSGLLARDAGTNVGLYNITQGTLALSSNYTLNFTSGVTFEIKKKALYITAENKSKQYSDPFPTFTVTYSGFVMGEGPSNLSGTLSCTTTATTTNGPGTYPITCSGLTSSNYAITYVAGMLTVTPEDARVSFTGASFASTSCATCNGATVTLAATIQDITALLGDPAYDVDAGDIRNATVTFVNRDAANAVLCTAPVGLINLSDMKTGTATCNWSANIGSADSQSYTVGIIANNFYTRNSSDDNTIVTVSKPLTSNFITGGGHIKLTNSAGLKAGDVNSKNNFGFNVKYNKQGTNLQGNINTIVRRTESDGVLHVYQIKGNSMTSLSVNPSTCPLATATSPCTAIFNGKASIQDITNPLAPIAVDGNATLQVTMTDKGEPGSGSDMIGITVWNKSGGLWFSSNWQTASPPKTAEQVLGGSPGGGNVVVH